MLAVLAAIALGVGVASTPQFVTDEALYVQAQTARAVVQLADVRTADSLAGGGLGW